MLRDRKTRKVPINIAAWMAIVAIGLQPVILASTTMVVGGDVARALTSTNNAEFCACDPTNAVCGCDDCQCGTDRQFPSIPLTVPPPSESSQLQSLMAFDVSSLDIASPQTASSPQEFGGAWQTICAGSSLETCALLSRFLC